jgi:hypothetical protein
MKETRENRRQVRALRSGSAKGRRTIRDASIFALVLALGAMVIYLTPFRVFEALTSRTALVIYMVMVAEYLFIKSTDRTRIYRIENQRLRDHRHKLEGLLNESTAALDDASPRLPAGEETITWRTRVEDLKARIRKLL